MALAEDDARLRRHHRRFQGRVGGAFAVAQNRDTLARDPVAGLQFRIVDDLSAEPVLARERRHVRLVRVQANTDGDEGEVVFAYLTVLVAGHGPAAVRSLRALDVDDVGLEAEMRCDPEMIGIVLQVFLDDRSRREIRRVLGQRPVGKLVKLPLNLDAEV